MSLSSEEILEKITEVLEEALGVDEDEVSLEATLTGDLGAESIDFLDIQFRLEKAFDIKIQQGEMFPDNVLQDPEFVQDNKVTDKGIAELKSRLPFADFSEFEADPEVENLMNVFTVDLLVKFIENKLAG